MNTLSLHRLFRLAGYAAGALFILQASMLQAQNDEPASGADRERGTVIEEVIVTARRVEEFLQDTPVSVTAFAQQELEQLGFSDVSDVARYTPNLDIRKSIGGTDDVNVSLRGMFLGDTQIGLDPTVGVYLDGIYIARNVGLAFDIVDTQRIEVLRGPQGTLFGRNTIGGAINIVAQPPQGALAFKQQLSYGNHGRRRFHSTLDLPTVARLSARLSLLKTEFDGTVQSLYSGKDLGGRETEGGRLALLWELSDRFTAYYAYDIARNDTSPNFTQITHTRPFYADPDGAFYGGARYDQLRAIADPDRQDKVPIIGGITSSDIDGHGLTLEWEMSTDLLVKSITGYRELSIADQLEFATLPAPADGSLCSSPNPGDYDFVTGSCANPVAPGTLVSGINTHPNTDQEQLSQEFQLIGSAFKERLRYTAGFYYFEEQGSSFDQTQVVIPAPVAAQGFAAALSLPEELIVPQNRGNSIMVELAPSSIETDNQSYAWYGDFTVGLMPRMEATLGFRYSIDHRESIKTDDFDSGYQTVVADARFSNFNPGLTLKYRWNDQVNTYAKVMSGYRAGGFNQRVSTVEAFKSPFNEENVLSYELGWKTDLLERSLRFNGAVFYADYTDRQITSSVGGEEGVVNDIINAGESIHSGLELELTWLPVAGMRISANYALLDITVEEVLNERLDPESAMPANPGVIEDVSDHVKPKFAPKHSGALSIEHQFEPASWGQLSLRLDASYSDEAETGNAQLNTYDTLDATTLVNARATLSAIPVPGNGQLRLSLWAKNLTDEEYPEMGVDFGVLGYAVQRFAEMRSVGMDLVYEFNH